MNISKINQIILITIALVKILNKVLYQLISVESSYLTQITSSRVLLIGVHSNFVLGGEAGGKEKKQLTLTLPFSYRNRKSQQRKLESCHVTTELSPFQIHFRALVRVSSVAEPLRRMVTQVPTSSSICRKEWF